MNNHVLWMIIGCIVPMLLIVIMLGFLLQWPTILTLAMFPILVVMYVRLARHEEREAAREFGEKYTSYAARTPGFFPHWRSTAPRQPQQ